MVVWSLWCSFAGLKLDPLLDRPLFRQFGFDRWAGPGAGGDCTSCWEALGSPTAHQHLLRHPGDYLLACAFLGPTLP